MTWRVIVQMSLTGGTNQSQSNLRSRIVTYLKTCGIRRSPTGVMGTYERRAVPADEAGRQLRNVIALLSDPTELRGLGGAQVDHLWIYIDRAKKPTPARTKS